MAINPNASGISEFERKYFIGANFDNIHIPCHILTRNDKENITMSAPLGEIIKDYIEHLSIPAENRDQDWINLEVIIRKSLNVFQVAF